MFRETSGKCRPSLVLPGAGRVDRLVHTPPTTHTCTHTRLTMPPRRLPSSIWAAGPEHWPLVIRPPAQVLPCPGVSLLRSLGFCISGSWGASRGPLWQPGFLPPNPDPIPFWGPFPQELRGAPSSALALPRHCRSWPCHAS